MELFDVVDKNRISLGYTKARGSVLSENEYNVGVEIWIFNNHKLLMTKRSINKSHPGMWEVPGGCSQTGETSINTLIRELKEEIGISVKKNDCELIDTILYKKQFVDVYKSNIKIDLSNVKLQKEEVSDIKFVTKDEFIEMIKNNEIVKSVISRYDVIKNKIKKDW